jgi:hypothetical protein
LLFSWQKYSDLAHFVNRNLQPKNFCGGSRPPPITTDGGSKQALKASADMQVASIVMLNTNARLILKERFEKPQYLLYRESLAITVDVF